MNWHGYCVSEIVGLAMQGARNGDVAQRDVEVISEGDGPGRAVANQNMSEVER
jgi:hypothetical protein